MLEDKPIAINFTQALDTKNDPWQLQPGKFLSFKNSVRTKGGLLKKRNGYGLLTASSPAGTYLTTLNDNLTIVGSTVSAYSSTLDSWITKGTLQPCALEVLPLIRNNLNQIQSDSAIAHGLILTVFTQTNTTTSAVVTQYLYAIADVVTGQNIVQPSALPVIAGGTISGSSRAFVVGNYFVIVSQVIVAGTTSLQYVSIPTNSPVLTTNLPNVSAAAKVTAEVYVPISSNPGWDAVAINSASNNYLFIAYNSTTTAQGVHTAVLSQNQIALAQSSTLIRQFNNAAYIGAIVSVCVDLTVSPNIFYVNFWNNSTTDGYTCAVYVGLSTITQQFAPQKSISAVAVVNLASAAQNNVCNLYSEVNRAYSYDAAIRSDFINSVTVSSAGVVGSPYVAIRSVGLASKAFIIDGIEYFLAAFSSTFQPSYFLINASTTTAAAPIIVAKLAYQNGGGYVALGLPSVTITDDIAQLTYLFKDAVEALNTLNDTQQLTAGGIYSQTGINLVSFDVGTDAVATAEIASNLHISGGYLSQYDGYLPVEHNFFLFPDAVEVTYTADSHVTPTGTFSSGSFTVVVSSATGISPGMTIADSSNASYIPSNTVIVTVSGTTLTISNATTSAGSGDNLLIQGNIAAVPTGASVAGSGLYYYQATYEWTDNQGLPYRSTPSIPVTFTTSGAGGTGSVLLNFPTLRLTAKVANKVKIVIYRWSVATQVYNQVTTIAAPVLNDTTVDSLTFIDNNPDSYITGNNILYTTGGVAPDYNAPASKISTLFDTRYWQVRAEDPNVLDVSKQVVQGAPVEMSPFFSIYVAPNTGTVGSTGPMTALAPMDDKIIIFKRNAIFYINGAGPDNLGTTAVGCSLGNYSQPTFITSVVGCTNQKSIVLTSAGLMFQSDKGIWLLDRSLKASYVGADVEAFNGLIVNSAQVIPETNYVVFTLNNNQMLMYDYYYSQWGEFEGPYVVSSCIQNNLHTLLDQYGNVLQETPDKYLDNSNPVLLSFTTAWINLASLQGYERFRDFYILAKFLSPHSLLVQVAYDYNSSVVNQKLIAPQNYSSPTPSPFGVPTPFGSDGDKEQWRVHAKKQLCQSFQISITEVFNAAYGTVPGAGFTMSGITCNVAVKKATRPIRAANVAGVS